MSNDDNNHENSNSKYPNISRPSRRPSIHWRKMNNKYSINSNKTVRKRLNFTDDKGSDDNGVDDNGMNDTVDSFSNYNRNYTDNYDDIDGLLSNRKRSNTRTKNCVHSRRNLNQHVTAVENNNTGRGNNRKLWLIVIAAIFFFGVCILVTILNSEPDEEINVTYDRIAYRNDLTKVAVKYKAGTDVISQIQTLIYMVSQKGDTDSFIFLYNSNLVDFSVRAFDDFVDKIASYTAKFLRNNNSITHVAVDSTKLYIQDCTELIGTYKKNVTKNAVLLLKNIHKLPSSLAMALHYYCDEYNPLIRKSAIFLTFDMADCAEQTFSYLGIEKCLILKWNRVPDSMINPLLTRVISALFDLSDVFIK